MDMLRFVLVFHDHQPVGNDPRIIEEVARASYRPLLAVLDAAPWLRHALHISGPLLAWMEAFDHAYLDRLGTMVARGQVELLTGGLTEPILASIPGPDRVAQVAALSDKIERRFGRRPQGLWLTERAWESEILPDLAAAGVRYVFMDDQAFIAAGMSPEDLTAHFLTEAGGHRLAVFPLDRRLRALVPWAPPQETEAYLAARAAAGQRVAVFGDDGEKFGAWPDTHAKVYEGGWLRDFLAGLQRLADRVRISLPSEVMAETPAAGLCYLPTSSYNELEDWALPPARAAELGALKARLGPEAERFSPFLRGSHWKHFLVRYAEANRAHKKMLALRALLTRRRRADAVWQDLYAAQCNDAYWHGWFGGVYLPLLRHVTWMHLARVERALRRREALQVEQVDLDLDGRPEVWIHSAAVSALLQAHHGGTLVEWTDLRREVNLLNVLTRRPEWYHARLQGPDPAQLLPGPDGQPPDAREGLAYDPWDRVSFRDRFLDAPPSAEALACRALAERGDFANLPYDCELLPAGAALSRRGTVGTAAGSHRVLLRKSYVFTARGQLRVTYRLSMDEGDGGDAWFATELNLFLPALVDRHGTVRIGRRSVDPARPANGSGSRVTLREGTAGGRALGLACSQPAEVALCPIRTLSQSERGFELTCQGHGLILAWPLVLRPGGAWSVEITAAVTGRG